MDLIISDLFNYVKDMIIVFSVNHYIINLIIMLLLIITIIYLCIKVSSFLTRKSIERDSDEFVCAIGITAVIAVFIAIVAIPCYLGYISITVLNADIRVEYIAYKERTPVYTESISDSTYDGVNANITVDFIRGDVKHTGTFKISTDSLNKDDVDVITSGINNVLKNISSRE